MLSISRTVHLWSQRIHNRVSQSLSQGFIDFNMTYEIEKPKRI